MLAPLNGTWYDNAVADGSSNSNGSHSAYKLAIIPNQSNSNEDDESIAVIVHIIMIQEERDGYDTRPSMPMFSIYQVWDDGWYVTAWGLANLIKKASICMVNPLIRDIFISITLEMNRIYVVGQHQKPSATT